MKLVQGLTQFVGHDGHQHGSGLRLYIVELQLTGTAGQLKLYDVEPKTAAMIMAIVANKMGKPLNELRFISIKEVK